MLLSCVVAQTQLTFKRPGAGGPEGNDGPPVLSVSQLVRGANRLLELRFPRLCVEGEVSNLRIVASGHAYFTLKDDFSNLSVMMWRSNVERLKFDLRDGHAVRVYGGLGVYVKSGQFQMYAERAEPAGMGALMQQLEALKRTLDAEGLFDRERKRPLPRWPRRIGVVTSGHGAAIHDILEVARQRCPSKILLAPSKVQGPDAPRTLVRGLARLCRHDVDVIIIGRGGGSVEDLWAFNDERLARTIARCPVPVVSAVGHEVDVSISDLVADVRAATPSHAAELVVPNQRALMRSVADLRRRLERSIERLALDNRTRLDTDRARLAGHGRRVVGPRRARLRALERRLASLHPRARLAQDARRLSEIRARLLRVGEKLADQARARLGTANEAMVVHADTLGAAQRERLDVLRTRLEALGGQMSVASRARLDSAQASLQRKGPAIAERGRLRLARAVASLDALSPLSVLSRGYAVVTDVDGRALTRAGATEVGAQLDVRLSQGSLRVTVDELDQVDANHSVRMEREGS